MIFLCRRLNVISKYFYTKKGDAVVNQKFNNLRLHGTISKSTPVTKLAKDTILYKYESPKFFKYLNIFAVVNFMLWAYMGKYSISSMKDVPVNENVPEDLPWWRRVNLGEGKYKHTLSAVCYIFGTAVLAASWIFTLRSVRYLVLLKGGQKLSIVTYAPAGPNIILTVPLHVVSCNRSRMETKTTLPLKVKNKAFHYLLDMRGEFRNPQLFDITAGMQRILK